MPLNPNWKFAPFHSPPGLAFARRHRSFRYASFFLPNLRFLHFHGWNFTSFSWSYLFLDVFICFSFLFTVFSVSFFSFRSIILLYKYEMNSLKILIWFVHHVDVFCLNSKNLIHECYSNINPEKKEFLCIFTLAKALYMSVGCNIRSMVQ